MKVVSKARSPLLLRKRYRHEYIDIDIEEKRKNKWMTL